jgi:hypothetical protein
VLRRDTRRRLFLVVFGVYRWACPAYAAFFFDRPPEQAGLHLRSIRASRGMPILFKGCAGTAIRRRPWRGSTSRLLYAPIGSFIKLLYVGGMQAVLSKSLCNVLRIHHVRRPLASLTALF